LVKCATTTVATLKRRVTIQSVSRLGDGQGGFIESWVDGATVYASIEPANGYQRFQAMQMEEPITHNIVMRYRSDVTITTRLQYGTRIFTVVEALNVQEDGRFLKIKAVERVVLASESDIGALLLETGAYLTLVTGGRILLGA
jgi:SPP1 family predicted phage head-tail adaptor